MRGRNLFVARVCALGVVAACGGGNNAVFDAAPEPDAPDAPGPDAAPPRCGYTETADRTNDLTAEPTALTVGGKPQIVCGTIDTGHFNADANTVDADGYRVTVDGSGDLVVRFFGSPGAAAVFDAFSVFVFNTDENPTLLSGGIASPLIRDHSAFLVTLPAGTYDLVVSVRGAADLAAPFAYELQVASDGPARCPAVTTAARYTEAADGAGTGNDVIAVDFDLDPAVQLTASTTDAPEPTGLTIDDATPLRITGSSASEDADDDYMDRDAYLIRTAPTTTELTLRLGWADDQTNLDYGVFPADQTAQLGGGTRFDGHEEYNVVAVKPDSPYWIWIASHDGSTTLPAPYDLTICGTAFGP